MSASPGETRPRDGRAVWFDSRGLQRGFKEHAGRGIGTYVAALAAELEAQSSYDRVKFLVEAGSELVKPLPAARLVLAPRVFTGPTRLETYLRQHLVLAAWLGSARPAAVHFAAQTDAPAFAPTRTIVTVHDVVLHRHGEWYSATPALGGAARLAELRFRWMRRLERFAITRAERVIVPSRVTADELAATLAVPRARIAVIPEAAGARFGPIPGATDAAIRTRLGLPSRYLLHTGGADARKRLPELIAVFDEVARDDRYLALVLVGPVATGSGWAAVAAAIDRARAHDRIRLPGVLDEHDLPAVYRGARALVLATRHEGFGLPVVEAFACGTPVVATAAPAVAEVAGDAALLVPVDEPQALAGALRDLLASRSRADEIASRGIARAAQFRWSIAAAETLAVYDGVLARAGSART
jgi:glycosyltransferase involved in cell wall biosynthesis